METAECGQSSDNCENKHYTESSPLSDERNLLACESEEAFSDDILSSCNNNIVTFTENTFSSKLHEQEESENTQSTVETQNTNSPVKLSALPFSGSSSRGDSNSDLFYSAPESLNLDTDSDQDNHPASPNTQLLPREESPYSSRESSVEKVVEDQVFLNVDKVPVDLNNQTSSVESSPPPDIEETVSESSDIDVAVSELDSALVAIDFSVANLMSEVMTDVVEPSEFSYQPTASEQAVQNGSFANEEHNLMDTQTESFVEQSKSKLVEKIEAIVSNGQPANGIESNTQHREPVDTVNLPPIFLEQNPTIEVSNQEPIVCEQNNVLDDSGPSTDLSDTVLSEEVDTSSNDVTTACDDVSPSDVANVAPSDDVATPCDNLANAQEDNTVTNGELLIYTCIGRASRVLPIQFDVHNTEMCLYCNTINMCVCNVEMCDCLYCKYACVLKEL